MLSLKAPPTFKAKVAIPIAGGESHPVEFTFRHMTATRLKEFMTDEAAKTRSDAETILAIAEAWSGVDVEFSRESVELLLQNYQGAAPAIAEKYVLELTQAQA